MHGHETNTNTLLSAIKQELNFRDDLIIRPIITKETTIYFIYLNGAVDLKADEISLFMTAMDRKNNDLLGACFHLGAANIEANLAHHVQTILDHQLLVLSGFAVRVSIGKTYHRPIGESKTQEVVRGPKEAFTESIDTNQGMLRERLRNKDLSFVSLTMGKNTKTAVKVVYIADICPEKSVAEVLKRLSATSLDSILESHYLEVLLESKSKTVFPTVYNTERPDVITAGLLEGRIAIMVDGTPFVLLVPSLLFDYLQSSEDYYQRADIASAIRFLRLISFFISLLTPAVFLALTTFHQEVIPTPLLVSLAAQREGIPFPAIIEVLLMELTFELLREAGIRLPSAVGSAVSIVGALVLGQAAVDAGIVSSAMVIVVSITAISNFVFPSYDLAIAVRLLRFVFIIFANIFGLIGITLLLILLTYHLTTLDSLGLSYLTGLSPEVKDLKQDILKRQQLDQRKVLYPLRKILKKQ